MPLLYKSRVCRSESLPEGSGLWGGCAPPIAQAVQLDKACDSWIRPCLGSCRKATHDALHPSNMLTDLLDSCCRAHHQLLIIHKTPASTAELSFTAGPAASAPATSKQISLCWTLSPHTPVSSLPWPSLPALASYRSSSSSSLWPSSGRCARGYKVWSASSGALSGHA